METQIKQFMLRALLAARDVPMPETTLRSVTRNAFPHVAITTEVLGACIAGLKEHNLIASTDDDIAGTIWMLTGKGIIRAEKLA